MRIESRFAFTLAEVLITLGIIGVVAAITIPVLIQNYQDKVLISQTKKAYSTFNNMFALAQQDNGTPGDNSELFLPKDTPSNVIVDRLAKYLQGAKVCYSKNTAECKQYYYEMSYAIPQYNNDDETKYYFLDSVPKLILDNGIIFAVSPNRSACELTTYTATQTDSDGKVVYNEDGSPQTYTYQSDICANVVMDVNGVKGPNQFGRDVYHLWVFSNRVDFAKNKSLGGPSLKNILSGNEKLEYTKYAKGQKK